MRILLPATLIGVLFNGVLTAQISITSDDFPASGDNFFVSQALDLTIDFSTTGPNATWDYSNLSPNGQIYREYIPMSQASGLVAFMFGGFAPTNYQASYFTEATALPIDQIGTFLPIPLENIYQFYRKTNNAITSVGYSMQVSGQGIPAKSDTIETHYEFPLDYQDEYFSRGYTNLDLDPLYQAAWIQHRTHSAYVDGWGQITTPYGTFDAIRVQHYITESDSINFEGNWFGIPVPDSYIYEWLATGEKEPILRIRTSEIGGNEVVTAVEYKDYFQPTLSVETTQLKMQVFPNPASEEVHLGFASQPRTISVLSGTGQLVCRIETPSMEQSLDVRTFPAGNYLVVVAYSNGQWGISQLVKQ